jgi:isopenicillin N synthase-like dioxygenase
MYNEYGEAVFELHKKLMAIISEELGLAPDFLYSKLGREKAFMRTMFNYYPPCPQPELVMGSSPHADACALTILQQEVPGLQVLHDGVWVPALTSSDHAFVVNIGDSLQVTPLFKFRVSTLRSSSFVGCFHVPSALSLYRMWCQIISNGRFKSVLHRAVVHSTSRISIPNFLAPGVDVVMQLAGELCNKVNPPLYKGVTLSDFLKYVIAEGYGRSESRAVENFWL